MGESFMSYTSQAMKLLICLLGTATLYAISIGSALAQDQNPVQDIESSFGQLHHIGGDVIGPAVTHTVNYEPKDEANRPITPTTPVIVGIIVDEKGYPQSIHLVRSSGVQLADASSLQAVSQYRFKPAKEKGRPVSVDLYVELVPRAAPLFSPTWNPKATIIDPSSNASSLDEAPRKLNSNIKPPVLLKSAEPALPQDIFGPVKLKTRTVVVQMWIDSAGVPTNLKVSRSSGDRAFDDSALDAVSKYRFRPASENNQPVPVEMKIEVNFDHVYK
jgi:TonB family protein